MRRRVSPDRRAGTSSLTSGNPRTSCSAGAERRPDGLGQLSAQKWVTAVRQGKGLGWIVHVGPRVSETRGGTGNFMAGGLTVMGGFSIATKRGYQYRHVSNLSHFLGELI